MRTRRGTALAAAAIACVALATPAHADPVMCSLAPRPPAVPAMPAKPVRFAAVGDSITIMRGLPFGPSVEIDAQSWIGHAATRGVTFAGGWARGGARTSTMAASTRPVRADVLVIVAGTNDVGRTVVPWAEIELNLRRIALRARVPRVILSSIPPSDGLPGYASAESVVAYNAWLRQVAQRNRWEWVDAGSAARGADCRFRPGMSYDGQHQTVLGARLMGAAIRARIVAGAR